MQAGAETDVIASFALDYLATSWRRARRALLDRLALHLKDEVTVNVISESGLVPQRFEPIPHSRTLDGLRNRSTSLTASYLRDEGTP